MRHRNEFMTNAESNLLVDQAVLKLSEHFNSVQILVAWPEGGTTKSYKLGAGDWYARQGLAHEFIHEDMARDNARLLGEILDKPDEGDSWKTPA